MSMITRLFGSRSRLDSSDPTRRLAAIEALSDDEARQKQASLVSLAKGDPEHAVRVLAITRLSDEPALLGLLDDPAVTGDAVARILALQAQGVCSSLAEEPRVLAASLAEAQDPEAQARKLLELGGSSLLVDALLGADRAARARLLELSVTHHMDLLQELERRSRDRDKTTNRVARQRLESIRQSTAAMERLEAAVEERLSSLEKPSADPSETERVRRSVLKERIEADLAELTRRRAELAAAGSPLPALEPLQKRVQSLQAEAVIAPAPATAQPDTTPSDFLAEASRPPDTSDAFRDLTEEFERLDRQLTTLTDFTVLAAERQRLTDQWLTRADQLPPAEAEHAVFERVSHRFQTLAEATRRLEETEFPSIEPDIIPDTLGNATDSDAAENAGRIARELKNLTRRLNHIGWPDWAPRPESLSDQLALADQARERLSRWEAVIEDAAQEVEEKLEALEAQIESGELKRARSGAGEIRKRLQLLPERSSRTLNQRLARASARLNELGDWQTFATMPKRAALLDAMREIADSPLPPQDQAHRIRSLRNEWNALGGMARGDDHKLADAFNEAAERAFEPCRAHFEAQAAVRARNLAAREQICESLGTYLSATDWSNADFKAAESIMRTARDEWRACHPVDRSAGKQVEEKFEALQAELHQHIKSEWDRNLATKRQIVADAQAMVESDQPLPERVEGAKRLQQRWKAVGTTPRRPDQTLWREFRAACDAIFESRDAAKQHEEAEIQNACAAGEQLLSDFRERLDDTSSELDANTLRTFQQEFDELPSLPQRLSRTLERERDELVRSARQVLADQRAAREIARLTGLKEQDAAVSALEQQLLAGETVSFTPPDPLFNGRCTPGAEPVSAEMLARAVIEAEIAAGLESEEADLRMSIQVELMNAGRGREALDATPEALTRRWCELGPKGAEADRYRERFFQAVGRLLEG